MVLLPQFLTKKTMKVALGVLLMSLCGMVTAHAIETEQPPPSSDECEALPQPLKPEVFEGLLANPPFTRSLGHSDSLILTGVARFENEVYATLYDTKTMQSQVISQKPNSEGWQLIGIGGDPSKMHTWTARIQMRGGKVASIRYQKPPPKSGRMVSGAGGSMGGPGGNAPPLSASQMAEAKQAAVNYREGFSSDGYPRQPPPEMVEKLSRMSVDQRETLNRQMIGLSNRGLGLEERRRIYEDMVNRSIQERR
ncbi:MAG: hypothetical protein ACAI34_02375 [Verrucomicrobium sp.]|nr:hypothetical protein [Verrucomicrobium sp.]